MNALSGFSECRKELERIKKEYFVNSLVAFANDLVLNALIDKTYLGFTGNTQTSYSCGIYIDGSLHTIISSDTILPKPVRIKVPKGKWVYLRSPYEGRPRSVVGSTKVDNNFGQSTAAAFLANYRSIEKRGWSLVMTTGTEYSELLEGKGYDVLSSTYLKAPNIMKSNIKPIK